jgi:drug/metabolite transporter (DMT)-like permease
MTIFVKLSGQNIGTFQIIFFRGLFTLLITLLIIKKKKKYLWGYNKKVLILRGVVGTLALLFVYESIQRFSLSEATVIQYLYPIFTVIFASIFLNERSSFKSYIAVAFGFLGVYSVLNYPFMSYDESLQYLDVLFALLGAIFTALAYVLVRLCLKLKESPYVIMIYFPLFTVPLSLPFTLLSWSTPTFTNWIYLFMIGLFTQLGQTFLTFGYRVLPAGKAATMSYIQVPLAALGGLFIFHENISFNFIIGSLLIFIAILFVIKKS